ncbi:hypothetical protein Tco_1076194 [Tanacetum coccineum]
MPPKRTSTSEAPAMTQAAIRKLVADSVTAALEAQATTMANADNTNRNTREREAPVARQCSYKEFMSCQPINFKGSEGGPEELETLCPTMVPDYEKMIEVFIGGLPRIIKGNVTASKPQTLEEAINIAQRLMDHVKSTLRCKYQVITNESLTTEELSTTTTTVTSTPTTATIITNHNRIEDKKPSGLMLSLQLKTMGILETVPCVRNALCITQDLALLSVILTTRWAI